MRYNLYVPHKLLNGKISYEHSGRRYDKIQKAAEAAPRDIDGVVEPSYIFDTYGAGFFNWFKVTPFGAHGNTETTSLDASPFPCPAPAAQVYWVTDDTAYTVRGRGGVSYHVMYGDPWEALGVLQGEFDTLKEALSYMRYHSGDAPMYRVNVERRHGEFSLKEIK